MITDRERWDRWEADHPDRAKARYARRNRWRALVRRVSTAKLRALKLCDYDGNCLLCHQAEHTIECPNRAYLEALDELNAVMSHAPRP